MARSRRWLVLRVAGAAAAVWAAVPGSVPAAAVASPRPVPTAEPAATTPPRPIPTAVRIAPWAQLLGGGERVRVTVTFVCPDRATVEVRLEQRVGPDLRTASGVASVICPGSRVHASVLVEASGAPLLQGHAIATATIRGGSAADDARVVALGP